MYLRMYLYVFVCSTLLFLIGCSGNSSPVTPENTGDSLDSIPIVGLTDTGDSFNAIGLMGAYELTINPDDMTADLVSKRVGAIGESYIVSGIGFFTILPCGDCLKLTGIIFGSDQIHLQFQIDHPFDPGSAPAPPSATNRKDLDVFDLAMVIKPNGGTAENYPLLVEHAYIDILSAPDGYTNELTNLIGDPTLLPYQLVVDESSVSPHTWNEFPMGGSETFDVSFLYTPGSAISFDTYLTMGYGASAKKPERLDPKYYNPEFNRKAAWKVEAVANDVWYDNDSTTLVDVEVTVYDWQLNAVVSTTVPYDDEIDTTKVYAASEVDSVCVEIPNMTNLLKGVSGGSGQVYIIQIANENLLPAGQYTSLVRVLDERAVGAIPPTGDRDFLINTPDGISLNNYELPEYATYQTFIATVVPGCTGYCWTKTWGGTVDNDDGRGVTIDQAGNVYVTGGFLGTVDFNPAGGGTHTTTFGFDSYLSKFDPDGNWQWTSTWDVGSDTNIGNSVDLDAAGNIYVAGLFKGTAGPVDWDVYLCKFDSSGNWQWTNTWGDVGYESALSVAADHAGNAYVTGYFNGTVDFNPAGGGTLISNGGDDAYLSKFNSAGGWVWAVKWGSLDGDEGSSVAVDQADDIYVAGRFVGTVDFNPAGGGTRSSHGSALDPFLSKFDSSGIWQWTNTWGGTMGDYCLSVTTDSANNVYVTGDFAGTADFDPNGGGAQFSIGGLDAFLSMFNSAGVWQWAQTWGGGSHDHGYSVATDQADNIYVAGSFMGTADFNPAGGGTQTSNGGDDAYFSKFDSSGTWMWAKTWGGTNQDVGWSVAADQYSNAYVTGYFEGTADFNPAGGGAQSSNGFSDAYLSKFHY